MDIANVSLVKVIPGMSQFFSENNPPSKTGIKSPNTNFVFWEVFLRGPRFLKQRSFPRIRLNIAIYTDARAMSPIETDTIDWESGVGIGGILALSGNLCEYSPLGINDKTHWLKGSNSLHRLISFFELPGTYVWGQTIDSRLSA